MQNKTPKLTTESNQYLTSRIETNQLINNYADLIMVGNSEAVSANNQYPRIWTTGNIICYMNGLIGFSAALPDNTVIARVPTSFARSTLYGQPNVYIPIVTIQGGTTSIQSIVINTLSDGINITYRGTNLIALSSISLHGISFIINPLNLPFTLPSN